jgi:GTP cyclohydrolase I
MSEILSALEKKRLIAEKMAEILQVLGLDLSDPSLAETPKRIAKMYVDEIFAGLDPNKFPRPGYQEENIPDQMILVKNITFVSFCEHHFVPIVGKAHVAYYPKKRVLGLSKIPRLVRYFAQRPQLQERLTQQITDAIISLVETDDVAVALQAVHFCVLARGVEDMSAEMETLVLKGRFKTDATLHSEFFTRIADSVQRPLQLGKKGGRVSRILFAS